MQTCDLSSDGLKDFGPAVCPFEHQLHLGVNLFNRLNALRRGNFPRLASQRGRYFLEQQVLCEYLSLVVRKEGLPASMAAIQKHCAQGSRPLVVLRAYGERLDIFGDSLGTRCWPLTKTMNHGLHVPGAGHTQARLSATSAATRPRTERKVRRQDHTTASFLGWHHRYCRLGLSPGGQ